ncbi:zinc-binding dehydrogenase [Pseudomonas sp. VD9]|uniref:zinc-binding dehydrogenase n=1 Tax=Pseudomonas sp. VD9 TaxID=3342076 RepID=UPI003C6C1E1A
MCIRSRVLPWLASGLVSPQLHAQIPLAQAAEAHRLLEANANVGKVVLSVAH